MGEGHVKIMEFRFDANQGFQVKAIGAVADLFDGQSPRRDGTMILPIIPTIPVTRGVTRGVTTRLSENGPLTQIHVSGPFIA
jgi:hypothetical protein